MYYSGHGKLDLRGQLCLATANTNLDTLRSTSVPITFLKSLFDDCRSNRIVLILDCCFSGAAGKSFSGVKGSVDDQLSNARGGGIHILTSSTSIETSLEREQEHGGQVTGVFTRCLVDGILSGDADIDNDAVITVDDLRRYLVRQIRGQTPRYWGFETSDDLVVARNPRARPSARQETSRTQTPRDGEPIFTLPVTILSVAALVTVIVAAIVEREGTGSTSWAPALTSATLVVLLWARPAEPLYRALITIGLALFVFRDVADAVQRENLAIGAASSTLWIRWLLEIGGFIALAAAFGTRGGWHPSAFILPYAAFAILRAAQTDFSAQSLLSVVVPIVAACMATQAWYRYGAPGAAWAAFGGLLWLGFDYVIMTGLDTDGVRLLLGAAWAWLVAMSVRQNESRAVRSHPASARWVLAGALSFFVWFLAARLNPLVLSLAGIEAAGPLAAAAIGGLVWLLVGGLIVAIFEGRSRAWPWKPFLGTGLIAAVACWLLVQSETGSSGLWFNASLACSLWALPLLTPFARGAVRPMTALESRTDQALWMVAAAAIIWSVLLIPEIDGVLGAVYGPVLLLAALGIVPVAFVAHSAYLRHSLRA